MNDKPISTVEFKFSEPEPKLKIQFPELAGRSFSKYGINFYINEDGNVFIVSKSGNYMPASRMHRARYEDLIYMLNSVQHPDLLDIINAGGNFINIEDKETYGDDEIDLDVEP